MANVQKYFEKFHEDIRADYKMSSTLQEKRDIILRRIRKHLAENKRPSFKRLLQGSYRMKTGVIPISNLEYDIDVGLRFYFSENDFSAETVREWVFEAVDGHTEKVEEKGPCIRVTYAPPDPFHVDLVVYACWEDGNYNKQFRLAHKADGWRPADPIKLIKHVRQARQSFKGTEDCSTKTDQFRRVVRYVRRANDVRFPFESSSKPTGLAFVLLCTERLTPNLGWPGECDDRAALEKLALSAANNLGRIVAKKPTPEYEDMFARLSDKEMDDLKTWFGDMAQTLREADEEIAPEKACKKLQKIFGEDFPVPTKEETAKRTNAPAIVTSSSSAA